MRPEGMVRLQLSILKLRSRLAKMTVNFQRVNRQVDME